MFITYIEAGYKMIFCCKRLAAVWKWDSMIR